MARFNEVRDTPADAGAAGIARRLDDVEHLLAPIRPPTARRALEGFLNAHLRAEKRDELWDAMMYWSPDRARREPEPAPARVRDQSSLLGGPLPPLYAIPLSACSLDRRLIRDLKTL